MTRICKVLIVEDDASVRALLGDIFDYEGYNFTLVDSGEAMRSALSEDDYEVVIIDISLRGGEDGLALAETAHDYGSAVILTTGDPDQLERARGSARPHLMKPFRMGEMIALVERVLKQTKARCRTRPRAARLDAALPI